MAFPDEKSVAINVLKAYDCDVAGNADNLLQTVEDIAPTTIYLLKYFECAPNVMTKFLQSFSDADLLSQKIYFAKEDTTVGDARIIANSTYDTVNITIPAGDLLPEIVIMGSSIIGKVNVSNTDGTSQFLGVLDVSAGATVNVLDISGTAQVKILVISGCNGVVSTVKVANGANNIGLIDAFNGGYFGGFNCIDPTNTCAIDVSGMAINKLTASSLLLNWVTPSESIRTVVQYRLTNTNDWLSVGLNNEDGVTGNYATDGTTGYAFRGLQMDTYYDFRVINVCNNGILSAGVSVTQKTNGIASSGSGGGGGDKLWVGVLQFLSTSGQTEYTSPEVPNILIGSNGVDVTVEGAAKFQDPLGSPTDDRNFQLDNVNGKVIFNSGLGDGQQVRINVFR